MQEVDFYTGLSIIRKSKEPITIIFTKLSLSKNKGGAIEYIENVIPGATKKNTSDNYMIGFQDFNDSSVIKHIYIHTILEYVNSKGEHFKLILN